jgi:hypothetical protein
MLRHRSANSGVARFSQHMLGHAMDFYIPGVPLEQIRYAGLRLQRGGVGFYPTSGSPFVHLDTGSIRHWPRMTHDQLAKVFPDGRTVHVPTDGVPLKNYELAKADIEKRGDGDDAATIGKASFLASLFKGKGKAKANDDEEEAAAPAPVEPKKPAPVVVAAVKPAAPAPAPRGKLAAAVQLASADVQSVQPPKVQPAPVADKAEPKPQTPADIINARGFWGDDSAPKQATPAQVVAAISARKALETADPQPTASVPAAYQALAYAPPASSPVDHSNIVAASAPIPRSARPARNAAAAATEINTIATKGVAGKDDPVTTATRLSAGKGSDLWIRIMMLAPSASRAMSVTVMGDSDMTAMRAFFIKPASSVAMSFSEDPLLGMSVDHFSGSATTKLEMTSFSLRTAMLR